MTIGKKITLGLSMTLAILAIVGSLSFWKSLERYRNTHWVNHTHEVLGRLENLLSYLKDVETGQRGYLLTGEPVFLKSYHDGVNGVNFEQKSLRALIDDNEKQKVLFDRELEPLVTARLKFAADVVGSGEASATPAVTFAEAVAKCKKGTGKDLMDKVRDKVHEMKKIEQDLLNLRQGDAQQSSILTMVTSGLGTLIGFVIILVGGIIMIRSITQPVRSAIDQLTTSSAEILATTTQQAAGAQEQAAAVSQTVATVDEVTQTADQAAQRAKGVGEAVRHTLEIGKTGRRVVDESIAAMHQVKEQTEATAENILLLAEQAQAIGEIIATVNDVAEQTNLLALNAAIEASRAGEHGKGFSVVAGEVKALADQSKKATGQVRQILGQIQKATNTAVLSIEVVTKGVAAAIKVGGQAGDTIKTLAETLGEAAQAASQIAASVNQQATGMGQIHQAMKNIDQVAKQNLAATRQATQAAEDLNSLGTRLARLIAG